MAYRVNGSTDHQRRLFGRHATEVVHFDDLRQWLIVARQRVERIVQIEHPPGVFPGGCLPFDAGVPASRRVAAAAFRRATRARVIDEHLSHDTRHEREKVRAIGESRLAVFEELDEGLVDQRRGLKRMRGRLAPHVRPRDAAQLAVQKRQQLLESGLLSLTQSVEETCDG